MKTLLSIILLLWSQNTPGNLWNCRCTVVQVRKGKYPTSDPELAMKRGDNCTASVKQQIFRYNPGKTMELFPPKHPYYKAPAEAKKEIKDVARYEQNKALYNRLKEDKNYFDVEFDEKSGGVKATHVGHNFDPTIGRFGIPRGNYEKITRDALLKKGYKVVLRKEFGDEGIKQPDGYVNDKLMDIKGIEGNPLYALSRANKQRVETTILYFHDQSMFNLNEVEQKFFILEEWLQNTYEKKIPISIKQVIYVVNKKNGEFDVGEIKNPKE